MVHCTYQGVTGLKPCMQWEKLTGKIGLDLQLNKPYLFVKFTQRINSCSKTWSEDLK